MSGIEVKNGMCLVVTGAVMVLPDGDNANRGSPAARRKNDFSLADSRIFPTLEKLIVSLVSH